MCGLNSKKLGFLSSTVLLLKHTVVTGNVADAAEVMEPYAVWWSKESDPVVGEGSTYRVYKKVIYNLQPSKLAIAEAKEQS